MKLKSTELGIELPIVSFEPGRSIIANAGITLYTVGSVKESESGINYISVDGGMTDNIRHALYNAEYTILPCLFEKNVPQANYSVAGRCCESGDIIQSNVFLPNNVKRGDVIACLTTGAYNYSMASNYNRLPRPPIIMLYGNENRVAVRRESVFDICSHDI